MHLEDLKKTTSHVGPAVWEVLPASAQITMVIVGWPWILSMAKRLSGRLCVQSAQAKSSRAGAGAITFQLEPSHSAAIFEDMMRSSVSHCQLRTVGRT